MLPNAIAVSNHESKVGVYDLDLGGIILSLSKSRIIKCQMQTFTQILVLLFLSDGLKTLAHWNLQVIQDLLWRLDMVLEMESTNTVVKH